MDTDLNILSNVISNHVSNKYKLDALTSQLFSSYLVKIIKHFSKYQDKILDINLILKYKKHIYYLCALFIIYHNYKNIISTYKKFNFYKLNKVKDKVEEKKLVINNKVINYKKLDISNLLNNIHSVNKYIKLNPEFFATNKSDKKIIEDPSGKLISIYTNKVFFIDPIHNKKGYLVTDFIQDLLKENQYYYKMIIYLEIDEDSSDTSCYIDQINNYVDKHYFNGEGIKLNYYKILSERVVEYQFYNNDLINWKNDIGKLRDEFFSEHKSYLFDYISKKTINSSLVDTRWSNLILYGPPGTGKSSFVNRIAISLKMDIVSVDLSLYLDKKKELFSLFHKQKFTLPTNNKTININNKYIIILDEFDACIEKLISIEKIYEYKKSVTERQYLLKDKMLNSKKKQLSKNNKVQNNKVQNNKVENNKVENNKVENNKVENNKVENYTIDYQNFNSNNMQDMMMDMINDDDFNIESEIESENEDESNNEEIFNQKSYNKEKRKYNEDLININGEINMVLQDINESNKSDVLRLTDLLELFQGPIPIKDRMIIATTNNFEKIKDVLPALFRSGRLTPIKFDYLDWCSFCELCEYYFNETPKEEFEISIPTSQLVEETIKFKNNFNGFIEYIKSF